MKASKARPLSAGGRGSMGKGYRRAGAAILLAVLVALFGARPAPGAEKLPLVIFTVDVETTSYGGVNVPMPEQFEALCDGGVPCGIKYMSGALMERGYPATFFLDVYEHKVYGNGPIRGIARWLEAEGHDVELHTHPQWAYDRGRRLMYDYTLDEQKRIVADGKGLLEDWISRPVVAHRAGAYGADENTLVALVENGIYLDSSLFFGSHLSRLAGLRLKRTALSKYGPLYEVPVTVFLRRESSPVLSGALPDFPRIRKYDFNWFRDFEEARSALDEAEALGMDFVVLFLHSFTFIDGRGDDGGLIADREAVETFEKVLELLGSRGYRTATFRDLAADTAGLDRLLDSPDRLPEITVKLSPFRYLLKLAGINRSNYMYRGAIAGAWAVGIALIVFIFVVMIRRRFSDV